MEVTFSLGDVALLIWRGDVDWLKNPNSTSNRYCMAYVAGKESPTAADVKKILTSIDAEAPALFSRAQ